MGSNCQIENFKMWTNVPSCLYYGCSLQYAGAIPVQFRTRKSNKDGAISHNGSGTNGRYSQQSYPNCFYIPFYEHQIFSVCGCCYKTRYLNAGQHHGSDRSDRSDRGKRFSKSQRHNNYSASGYGGGHCPVCCTGGSGSSKSTRSISEGMFCYSSYGSVLPGGKSRKTVKIHADLWHYLISVTPADPPQRPWIPLAHPDRTRPTCIFTVMCYNVLCDKYATRQMYGYCPTWALGWEYRRKGIMDEIRHYAADIISLQEVETDQFFNYFLPELKREGYDGIFSPKSRAKTMMSEVDRKQVDGCAIFFRSSKFALIREHLVEFNQLAIAHAEGSDDMFNRVMTKDNIGLAAVLETKEAAWENGPPPEPNQIHQPLVICTAHIHWDPEYCDVKLIQTMMLMNELKQITEEACHNFRPGMKPDPNSLHLLLCGDFNSLPDSGVIEYLSQSRVPTNHQDLKDLGYKSCLHKMSASEKTAEYSHAFKLSSAYSADIMPFTNYTFDFKGIIDYIFYSRQNMNPLGVLGPLDSEWLRDNKVIGCPHPNVPSDHFPLLAELEMTSIGQPHIQHPNNGLIQRR